MMSFMNLVMGGICWVLNAASPTSSSSSSRANLAMKSHPGTPAFGVLLDFRCFQAHSLTDDQ